MHTTTAGNEDEGATKVSALEDDDQGRRLRRVVQGMAGLLVGAACVYGMMIYLSLVRPGGSAKVILEMPVSNALTVIALAGAMVVALRSWIWKDDSSNSLAHGTVQIILLRSNLAVVSGLLAVVSSFACLAQSAPERVEIGGIITLVFACVVALIGVDTAGVVPRRIITAHRERTLQCDRDNLKRAHQFWSGGCLRGVRWTRTRSAVAVLRSSVIAGGAGTMVFEFVESRDGSWNVVRDVAVDITALTGAASIVLVLSLLALRAWALSDWSNLALTTVFVTLFLVILLLACLQTIVSADGTLGWAISAGFLTSLVVVGIQLWPVCARSRSRVLRWFAPIDFGAVIAERADHVKTLREDALRKLRDKDRPKSPSKFRRLLRDMRGISSPA